MTKEEYDRKISEYDRKMADLHTEFVKAKEAIDLEFARSNSSVTVGDIVCDHIGKIRVEKITANLAYMKKYPELGFWGRELRKDGKPKKSGKKRWTYQSNLIKEPC